MSRRAAATSSRPSATGTDSAQRRSRSIVPSRSYYGTSAATEPPVEVAAATTTTRRAKSVSTRGHMRAGSAGGSVTPRTRSLAEHPATLAASSRGAVAAPVAAGDRRATTSSSPGRHAAASSSARRSTWAAAAAPPQQQQQLSQRTTSTNLSGSNIHVLPRNGVPPLRLQSSGSLSSSSDSSSRRNSHRQLPPSSAASAAASHARAGSSTVVASVSLTSSSTNSSPSLIPVWSGGSARTTAGSPIIAPVSLRSKPPPAGQSVSAGSSPKHAALSLASSSGGTRSNKHPTPLEAVEVATAWLRGGPTATAASGPLSNSMPRMTSQRPSTARSGGTPVVSISLSRSSNGPTAVSPSSSSSLEDVAATAHRRVAQHQQLQQQHHRRTSSALSEEEDDPSMPIATRHARAVDWLLRALARKEEPLYCPSWFTAVDPAAMVGLADARHAYLELVGAFSLRAQALAYIDDVQEAWVEDKMRAKERSKTNMMRVLQRKPPLPQLAALSQHRRPSFSQLQAVKRAAAAANAANVPQPVRDRESAVAAGLPISLPNTAPSTATAAPTKIALVSLTSPSNGTTVSAAAAGAASKSTAAASATDMLASFEALLSATTASATAASGRNKPSSRGRSASALSAPSPRSLSASPSLQLRSSTPPIVAVSLTNGSGPAAILSSLPSASASFSLSSSSSSTSAAALLASGRLLSSSFGAKATQPFVAAAAASPASTASTASAGTDDLDGDENEVDDNDDDEVALLRFKALLATHPVLLKHSVRSSSSSSRSSSAAASAGGVVVEASTVQALPPKASEMRLLDARLYHSWKSDRAPEQNRKFVRLREIVEVRPGRSKKLLKAAAASGSINHNGGLNEQELNERCFHILSLPSSAREAAAAAAAAGGPLQLPVFDELNLQADSPQQCQFWMRGLKLLVAEGTGAR